MSNKFTANLLDFLNGSNLNNSNSIKLMTNQQI